MCLPSRKVNVKQINNRLPWIVPPHDSLLLGIYVPPVVKFVKEYPYPDYFFHTAIGFSRSTLLKAKEKQIKPDRLDL